MGVSQRDQQEGKKKNQGRTLGLAAKDHATDGPGIKKGGTHDLHDPDAVHIEVLGVGGHHRETGVNHQGGEEVLVAVLLASNNTPDGGNQVLPLRGFDLLDDNAFLLHLGDERGGVEREESREAKRI